MESTLLETGKTIERQFAGGQAHEYRFTLQKGQYAKLQLFQRSINVAVECFGPDGKLRFEADSHRIDDTEISELIADASGSYRLRVTAPDRHAPLGRYNITLAEVVPATDRHQSRIAAARAFALASKFGAEASRESELKAIENFEIAAGHWHAANDLFEEARTLLIVGTFYGSTGDQQKGFDRTTRAITVAQASHDRRIEAWAYVDHAMMLNAFGDKRKAIEFSDRGLPLMREVGDRAGEASALNNLGRSYAQTGEGRKGLTYFEESLKIYREIQDRELLAGVLNNLGTTYDNLGEYQRALEYHQQNLALQRELERPTGEAISLNNTGSSYSGLGEYQKALDVYMAALEINRRLDNSHNVAVNLHNIAWIYENLGDPERAIKYFQEALALLRAAGDQWGLGSTLNNLASVYTEMADYTSALKLQNEALACRRAVADAVGEATSLNNIGRTYFKLGDRQKAGDNYERSLAILRKTGEQSQLAMTLRSLGTFHRVGGDYQLALTYLEEAIAISRGIQDRRGEATALAILARVEGDRGNFAAAHQKAEEALASFESLRSGVTSPTLRASFFISAREAQETDIEALVRLHEDAAALLASERGRARSLLEMLAEGGVEIRRGVDAGLLARERELQQLISAKAEKQVRLLSREHTESDAQAAAKELDALTTEFEQVQSKIRESSPQFASLTQPAPLDLKEIQTKVLDTETVLLEYSMGTSKSFLWAVTPSSVDTFELPARAEIESSVRRVYELLTARNQKIEKETPAARAARVRHADQAWFAAAAKASAMLLGPATSRIQNKRILIVGEAILQYLPFGALPDPADAGQKATPLIVNHEVITAPSASVLAVLRQETAGRQRAEKAVAVLADPVFNDADSRIGQQKKPSAMTLKDRSASETSMQSFERLRFSRSEAEEIARLAPPGTTLKALDFEASREAVLQSDLGKYRIVHFATHSLLNNEHPELSGVVLSLVDRSGRPQNGFLRLYDIYNLRLGSDLVVLSACQTALGGEIKGEGLIGLTRGFLYAGAPRVVATLWEIDDRTTAELMKHFYESMLGRGERPAAALRAAQVAMWRTKGWEAPYYWGAFTLQGEWR